MKHILRITKEEQEILKPVWAYASIAGHDRGSILNDRLLAFATKREVRRFLFDWLDGVAANSNHNSGLTHGIYGGEKVRGNTAVICSTLSRYFDRVN
jgi:hypothetical protein